MLQVRVDRADQDAHQAGTGRDSERGEQDSDGGNDFADPDEDAERERVAPILEVGDDWLAAHELGHASDQEQHAYESR